MRIGKHVARHRWKYVAGTIFMRTQRYWEWRFIYWWFYFVNEAQEHRGVSLKSYGMNEINNKMLSFSSSKYLSKIWLWLSESSIISLKKKKVDNQFDFIRNFLRCNWITKNCFGIFFLCPILKFSVTVRNLKSRVGFDAWYRGGLTYLRCWALMLWFSSHYRTWLRVENKNNELV